MNEALQMRTGSALRHRNPYLGDAHRDAGRGRSSWIDPGDSGPGYLFCGPLSDPNCSGTEREGARRAPPASVSTGDEIQEKRDSDRSWKGAGI